MDNLRRFILVFVGVVFLALSISGFVLAVELGSRFLADYLDGDLYFNIKYPEHNLVRARSQMKLAADMEKKLPEMNRIVAEVVAQTKK